MKKFILFSITCCVFNISIAQKKPAEKAPTQKEMQEMMKEAQGMMEEMMKEMSPEDKKAMDSMGIKMPDLNKAAKDVSQVSDGQMAEAWDKENRIVFPKNAKKIAAIPSPVGNAGMGAYINSVLQKTFPLIKPQAKSLGEKIFAKLSATNSATNTGNSAAALWLAGKTQIAFVVMGKICAATPSNVDNIGNFASMLSMMGAPELAIPILNNLNSRFPKNSTILNNIGQAWFGMGDMVKAEKYLDSVIKIYTFHTQANLTKALIEEDKGKKPEAIVAIKRSIKQGYSDDKKNKLAQLGYKTEMNDYTLPPKTKADPLNLGSFNAPAYPKSVSECISLGAQWQEYKGQINQEQASLLGKKTELEKIALKASAAKTAYAVKKVNTAQANPGSVSGPLIEVPIYAERAGKKMFEVQDDYARKIKALFEKITTYFEGEGKQLEDNYEETMAKLKAKDLEQTGEGKPNVDFCPQYREASDKYLKAINTQKEIFYKQYLQIEKQYINEMTYWAMYSMWPEDFEVFKAGMKHQWLETLKARSPLQYVSITEYVCKSPVVNKDAKLQKFDDVACQYHSKFWTPVGQMEMNCSNWKTTFDIGVFKAELKQDMDQETFGDQFQSCTIQMGPRVGKEVEVGPIKVGAEAGTAIGVEIGRNGVTDVFVVGGVEAGAGVGPIEVSAGVEGKVSFVSGAGSVNGTGVFEGLP